MVPWLGKMWPTLHTDWLSEEADRPISPAHNVLVFPTRTDFVWHCLFDSQHIQAGILQCFSPAQQQQNTNTHQDCAHWQRKIQGSLSVILLPLSPASLTHSMHKGNPFSSKTLGKSLFHFQNDQSGHGLAGRFSLLESAFSHSREKVSYQ